MAATSSRRGVLRGLIGAAAGVLGLAGAREAGAATCRAPGLTCREHANCCSELCGPRDRTGRRRCQCQAVDDCPAPDQCHSVACVDGACVATVLTGQDCNDGNACTTGETCQANGTCGGTALCAAGCICVTLVATGAGACVTFEGGCSFPCDAQNPCQQAGWICINDGSCGFSHCHPTCTGGAGLQEVPSDHGGS